MKLAYLILAHHQPALLARLIDRLLGRDVHAFIYIDGKVDMGLFSEALGGLSNPWAASNLHVATPRRPVSYMGFSTVEATLSLMHQAHAFGRFEYYTLLSGADYPIKSQAAIRDVLFDDQKERIAFWKLEDRPSWKYKVEHFYLMDLFPVKDLRPPSIRRLTSLHQSIPHLYWRTFRRARDWFPKRAFPFLGMEPYGGSQWWSITHSCMSFVLRFVNDNPDFCRFYRYAHCPDEMFFQTIVLNSDHAANVAYYDRYCQWSAETPPGEKTDATRIPEPLFNLRYIDWSGPVTGGLRGYPAVLDETDFPALSRTPCLFARKVDLVTSRTLLNKIDQSLLGVV